MTRTCSGCRRTLPRTAEFFHADRSHSSGFQRRCRACTRGHLDRLDAAPAASLVPTPAPQPKNVAAVCLETFAEEIATATVRYAVKHDPELLHQIADYLAGPLPDTDDEDRLAAAEAAEMERCPTAALLRWLADVYDEPDLQRALT